MTTWVADQAPHVVRFERKCSAQGINIAKQAPGEYTDPRTAELWVFYAAGANQENHKWMADFY